MLGLTTNLIPKKTLILNTTDVVCIFERNATFRDSK